MSKAVRCETRIAARSSAAVAALGQAAMIDEMDARLVDWVGSVLAGVEVSLGAPAAAPDGEGISLYLMDLRNEPAPRSGAQPPLQITLRYLVSAWAEQPERAHRLLGDLVFAALELADLEVELEPLDPSLWSAFGVAPRPAFVIKVPLRRQRTAAREVRLVRLPLELELESISSLEGTVVGPNQLPIAGALVEVPALGKSSRTDRRGRFHFAAVPGGGHPYTVRVEAKGRRLSVQASPGQESLVIHFENMED